MKRRNFFRCFVALGFVGTIPDVREDQLRRKVEQMKVLYAILTELQKSLRRKFAELINEVRR